MILQPSRIRVVNPLPPKKKKIGLGDAVAFVAKPTAEVLDAMLKTNYSNCDGCRANQAALNKAIPDIFHPFSKE